MERLSEKEHWDAVHNHERKDWEASSKTQDVEVSPRAWQPRLKAAVKAALGARMISYMSSFEESVLWDIIYPKYLPQANGIRVVEVGSAPGEHLVKMRERFNYEPYGVDYSESGVQLNKEVFAAHNIDPGQVIHADFFAADFQAKYREAFDVVISRGFIEHFTDVEDVIQKHIHLLAKGGRMVIMIPNLRGVNYALGMLFNREVIEIHNLSIMQKRAFSKLFENKGLSPLFCAYNGVFNFYLMNTKETSPMRHVLKACFRLQMGLNVLFHLLFWRWRPESKWLSPSLIFIGVKEG